jgi:hypothetical protein
MTEFQAERRKRRTGERGVSVGSSLAAANEVEVRSAVGRTALAAEPFRVLLRNSPRTKYDRSYQSA